MAIERGYISLVQYLLSLRNTTLPPDPLFVALRIRNQRKRAHMVRLLLQNGITVHARTTTGDSLLHVALESFSEDSYSTEVLKTLVDHGCDPLETNSSGKTPLQIAIELGRVSFVRHLLSLGVAPSHDLLFVVARLQNQEKKALMMGLLLEKGVNVRARTAAGNSLLHVALESFSEEDYCLRTVKLLVCHGCDAHQTSSLGKTPFHIAVEQGHTSIAEYLLSSHASTNLPRDIVFIALNSTRCRRKLKMLAFLIDQGADVLANAQNGDTALHAAVASLVDDEVLQGMTLLLERGCDPRTSNVRGATPLHVAVERGHTAAVMHFLSLRVPLPPDILFTAIQHKQTPDWWASEMDIIEALVDAGCDTQTRDASGHTPSDAATMKGHTAVVEYLRRVSDVVDTSRLEDLLSAMAVASPDIQEELKRLLRSHFPGSETP